MENVKNENKVFTAIENFDSSNLKHVKTPKDRTFEKHLIHEEKMDNTSLNQTLETKLTMKGILKRSYRVLKDFINPKDKMNFEKGIPKQLLEKCKGIVFITLIKGGVGIGGTAGTGILITRNKSTWSYPVAIGMGGISIGFQVGISKIQIVLVLTSEEAVKTFSTNGQLKLGGDFNISAGPQGREASMGLIMNKQGLAPIYAYSMTKGGYVGITIEGQIITVRDECNEKFYKQKRSAKKILNGDVKMPNNSHWNLICELLNNYIQPIKQN
jgi:lipid-binding SYLF domain-containing protein